MDPAVFWAHQELFRLSEKESAAVARAILAAFSDLEEKYPEDENFEWRKGRAYLATVVSEKARRLYEKLERGESIDSEDETGENRKRPEDTPATP